MSRAPVTLGLALALAPACHTFDEAPEAPDVALPEAWVSPTADDGGWSFGDATLEKLIAEALENNRELASAAARLDAALAQARIAGADRLPALDANLSGSRVRQNFVGLDFPGAPDPFVTLNNSFGVSLDLSWEVDLWGRVKAGALAAEADARASAADLVAAQHSIAAQTAKAWFALVEARQQVALARDTVESFEDNAEWIRERYERGVAQPLDLRLALSNAADARAALEGTQVVAGRAARQLEVLLGRYPANDAEGSGELPTLAGSIPAGLPSELLERRPDLHAARERLIAADRRLDQAEAARLPSLRLTASGGRSSEELSNLTDGDFDVWSLAGGLTAPIFHGGALEAGEVLADARTAEAYALWAQRALVAFAEVETALDSEAYLERRVRELREATDQARAAERLARDRYRAGVEGVLAVLEAQRRAVSNEARWLAARRERLDNRIDLWLALGGTPSGTPVEGDDDS